MRWLLLVFAVLCLVLAAIGVVVPGMPTTVFVLLAGWAAARSSPRLAAWLEHHRVFGPLILDWRNGGRVRRRAKWSATVAMTACAGVLLWTAQPRWATVLAIVTMAVVLAWLWRRPEPPGPASPLPPTSEG